MRLGRELSDHTHTIFKRPKGSARRHSKPPGIWANTTASEQWAANVKFLDRGIAKGAEFIVASPRSAIRESSALAKEVGYLLNNGYEWSKSGWSQTPK